MKTENEIDLDNVISGGVVSNPFCFTQYCEAGDENNRITHVEIKNIKGGDKTGECVDLHFESEEGENWVLSFDFSRGRTCVTTGRDYYRERENITVSITEGQR